MKYNILVVILGPTSVGKTQVSLFLAKKFNTQILSCDSRQFYKELKIGTCVPNKQILNSIQHHFIGHLSIHDDYNAKLFEQDAINKLHNLFLTYSILIMVGGSSLYEKAVTVGLSQIPKINKHIRNELRFNFKKHGILFLQKEIKKYIHKIPQTLDIQNPFRLMRYLEIIKSTQHSPSFFFSQKKQKRNFITIKIGLILPKEQIYSNINNRVDDMMKMGLLNEAKNYYEYRHLNSLNTIGYKEIFKFFSKETVNIYHTIDEIKTHTRQYAKKQLTWYKKDPDITWFSPKDKKKILFFIINKMGNTGFEPVTSCL
ncbi:tRNA (adenosine(37)-N6)-dimethylallyltransferase MiaA [Blattabacterium cuenoti]|uniref:tRNA (adenosine(37)-N6)-dimethylallyltransferase MiaA n=1 Tax=Blattabacterium cuenoti TaxID=1653831 RepID=UPI00163CF409|nr:tRNA (adenosine(37)-N6)-dimethylallyltransferase MiaA [Blattabacterium cuenoti]